MHPLKSVLNGVCAGIVILMGCSVYLACENVYVGAILFSVALLCICMRGYALFTGRVCFLPEDHGKKTVPDLLLALLGNALATCLIGMTLAGALPNLVDRARTICTAKLAQTPVQTFLRGVFCGILMYLAVSIFRDKKTSLAIFFCISTFILSGFEHSIADMGYFAVSGIVSWKAFGFLGLVILGNSIGGVLLPILQEIGGKRE